MSCMSCITESNNTYTTPSTSSLVNKSRTGDDDDCMIISDDNDCMILGDDKDCKAEVSIFLIVY